jgi:cobalt-zinc-cadmium efflux system membrane fusion protein
MNESTVLLVDDDVMLRQVLRRVLAGEGHQVVEAHDVAGALAAARATPPRLALLDLRLPDGDGVELARKLEEQGGRFPLILMTADPLRLQEHPELARDFAGVLTKPLDLRELRRAVDAALGAAPPPAGSAGAATAADEPRGTTLPQQPTTRPTAPDAPAPRTPRWRVAAGAAAAVALFAALWVFGMPHIRAWVEARRDQEPSPNPSEPDWTGAAGVPGDFNGIEVPPQVAQRLGLRSVAVTRSEDPRPLRLSGILNYDADRLASVRSRFAGEVIQLEKVAEPGPNGQTQERVLSLGDRVEKGQLLAVVWSRDQGQLKSALVDALVKLWLDEKVLSGYERASSSLSEVALTVQRNQVSADRSAVNTARNALATSRVPPEEVEEVERQARQLFDLKDDPQKDRQRADRAREWAKVEVRSPIAGTVVEKNVNFGAIVDTSTDLYKVADLSQLAVWAHAYEEDLTALQGLPRPIPWTVRLPAEEGGRVLPAFGIEKVAPSLDPNQHTALLIGRVDNAPGALQVGRFVTASVALPPPRDVVAVPSTALVEGEPVAVFVQPDPARPAFSLRAVAVGQRYERFAYVKSRLSEAEKRRGLQELRPGERVLVQGALELRGELRVVQGRLRAREGKGPEDGKR